MQKKRMHLRITMTKMPKPRFIVNIEDLAEEVVGNMIPPPEEN